ncbi:MAG: AMP-binding protein, partial [Deltaproteobacteria bacterium]|nr:AMP-binding protein [Deltaproteobacteria bacterium]
MESRPWQRHYDYDVPTTIRYPRVPAHDLMQVSVNAYPDKAALNFYGTETTFWELREQILFMANALGSLGIKKGDRVGVHLPTCPQYVIAYHAVLHLGAIVVNLNPMYTAEELKALAQNTGITTLFTFDMVLSNIRSLCGDVEIPRVIVTRVTDYINGFDQSTPEEMDLEKGWHHFSLLLKGCSDKRV